MRWSVTFLLLALSVAPVRGAKLPEFAGTYLGCLVSGQQWVAVAATLTPDGAGLSGTYVFAEQSGQWIGGTLQAADSPGDNRAAFIWADIYGSGTAAFTFAADGSRFDGLWSSGGEHFPWYGVRTGTGRPTPDCGAPMA